MDDGPSDRLSILFEQALDVPAAERDAFLDEACQGDLALREELASLLAAHEASSDYFEDLAGQLFGPALAAVTGGDAVSPGDVVTHYQLLERLGSGGMGVVYKARDLRLDRFVALKFLAPQLASDETARARMLTEARAASALDHPHIAVVHEIGEAEEGRLFIAMGWYEGETLQQRLRRGPLPVEEATDVAHQLASALAAAHGAGIIHRDVKPSNVVATTGGAAKLLDFGIARLAGADLTTDGATLGTIAYMSPEQARGRPVDHRTDLWSLGVVLYEMLAGRRPFEADYEQAMMYRIRHDEPEPIGRLRPEVSPELSHIVETCLQKNPEERYQHAEELLHDLAALDRRDSRQPLRFLMGFGHLTRFTPSRPAGMAMVATMMALVALTFYFVSARPAPPALDAQRVLVAPFENRTGQPALDPVGSMAADWIIQGLAQTGLVDVVPVTAALSASRFVAGAPESVGAAERIRMLAEETGAGIVVWGAVYQQGDSLFLQATVTDASRGRVLHALEPVVTARDEPVAGIEALRRRLLGLLAPRFNPRTAHHAAGGGVAPPSFEAYRAHAEGMERFTAGDWRGSVSQFMEAAAHDSSFTVPLLYAGIALGNMGNLSATDSILAIIRPRRHTLGEFEQLGFLMLDATVRGDLTAYYRAHLRAPEIAPGTMAHYGRGLSAAHINRPREAVRVFGQIEPERGELRGWYPYWQWFALAHHRLGDYRRELRVAQRALALYPNDPRTLTLEVRTLAARGRTAELRALLSEKDEEVSSPAALLRYAGLELIAHGSRDEGEALLRESLDWDLARPDESPSYRQRLAHSHYLLSEWDEAERLLRRLAAEAPDNLSVQGGLGLIAARRGDAAEALRISDWLAGLDRPYLHGDNTYWRARIASLLDEPEESVQLLRQAWREGAFWIWDAGHREPDFEPIRQHPAFREFIRPKG
jgi:tetratricopeptide (TPR) repeat protein/tRNA A-37 threonylcarbamoyl transferase component Bud32/TolB-like protein